MVDPMRAIPRKWWLGTLGRGSLDPVHGIEDPKGAAMLQPGGGYPVRRQGWRCREVDSARCRAGLMPGPWRIGRGPSLLKRECRRRAAAAGAMRTPGSRRRDKLRQALRGRCDSPGPRPARRDSCGSVCSPEGRLVLIVSR